MQLFQDLGPPPCGIKPQYIGEINDDAFLKQMSSQRRKDYLKTKLKEETQMQMQAEKTKSTRAHQNNGKPQKTFVKKVPEEIDILNQYR